MGKNAKGTPLWKKSDLRKTTQALSARTAEKRFSLLDIPRGITAPSASAPCTLTRLRHSPPLRQMRRHGSQPRRPRGKGPARRYGPNNQANRRNRQVKQYKKRESNGSFESVNSLFFYFITLEYLLIKAFVSASSRTSSPVITLSSSRESKYLGSKRKI